MRCQTVFYAVSRITAFLLLISLWRNQNSVDITKFAFNIFGNNHNIMILLILKDASHLWNFKYAMDTVACYAKIHNYELKIVFSREYSDVCPQRDVFFQRHCIVASLLPTVDYILFMDADVGVINPLRKIEEYIDDNFDITFYDRFFNHEIAAGGYIVNNNPRSIEFLNGFANYENKIPPGFIFSDNGALHAYLIEYAYPELQDDFTYCLQMFRNLTYYTEDLFIFQACSRQLLLPFKCGRIRSLPKGKGWVRDGWFTNSMWNPKTDFMIHGLKTDRLAKYTKKPSVYVADYDKWYNPFVGDIDLNLCHPGNSTWSYDTNLIADIDELNEGIFKFKMQVEYMRLGRLAKLSNKLKNSEYAPKGWEIWRSTF